MYYRMLHVCLHVCARVTDNCVGAACAHIIIMCHHVSCTPACVCIIVNLYGSWSDLNACDWSGSSIQVRSITVISTGLSSIRSSFVILIVIDVDRRCHRVVIVIMNESLLSAGETNENTVVNGHQQQHHQDRTRSGADQATTASVSKQSHENVQGTNIIIHRSSSSSSSASSSSSSSSAAAAAAIAFAHAV